MPLWGGLFSRKSKSSRSKRDDHPAASTHTSELDSALSSPTTSYVTHEKAIPNARNLLHPDSARELPSSNVYPSMASISKPPSGKKLRLPFAHKKNALPRSDLSVTSSPNVNSLHFGTSPRPANNDRASTSTSVSKVDPEDLRRLRPPPSRSAIFAAYGDLTGHSTHSLQDDASVVSELSFPPPSPFPQSSKKTSFFKWRKASTSNSSPGSPLGNPTLHTESSLGLIPPISPESVNSFSLKSFRHIRAPSPTHSSASNASLTTTTPIPRPRPRGESMNSESSQRISVAAFREAQAKRSLAGSPSPSFRAPSPVPPLLPQTSTSTSAAARGRGTPQSPYLPPQAVQLQNKIQPRGQHSSMVLYTSDSDSSSSSDDGTEDETIKRRPGILHSGVIDYERKDKGKAKSEMGHKNVANGRFAPDSAAPQRAPHSHSGHSRQSSGQTKSGTSENGLDFSSRSQSSSGHYIPVPKLQSSVSTTASPPSATVKLIATQITPTPNLDIAGTVKPSREPPLPAHSNSQNITQSMRNVPQKYKPASDSDSEDDTPLATLVGPRRPGSAMSSYSSLHARSTGNVTTRSTHSNTLGPAKPLIDINELTGPKRSFTTPAENSAAGFTQGVTLLSGVKSTASFSADNPSSLNQPLTLKTPPMKFLSPPSSPANEVRRLMPSTVDGGETAVRSDPITLSSEKSASPEQPRDALTDRLSRAVNMKFVSSSSNAIGPNISRAKNSVPSQTESPNIRVGEAPDNSRRLRTEKKDVHVPSTKEARRQPAGESPSLIPVPKVDSNPSDEDLVQLLGTAGIEFMLRNDEIQNQSSESESEEDEDSFEEIKKEEVIPAENRIAPIPIKQRPPAPSFSVTSRPPFPGRDAVTAAAQTATNRLSTASNIVTPRPRSITLTSSSTSSTSFNKFSVNDVSSSVPSDVPLKSASHVTPPSPKSDVLKPPNVRQRSSTIVTGVPLSVQPSKAFHVPERPFAVRRKSPASSTGDSSSGGVPLTPRDGSEIGVQVRKRDEWSGWASGLGVKHQHPKRRNFEEDLDSKSQGITHSKGKELTNSNVIIKDGDREARRKERRRSEAKAAIELGNVVNGPGPFVDDDDEMPMNLNISPRMSTLNPMMGMGLPMPMQMSFGSPNSLAWGGNMAQPMRAPSPYLMPPPADPKFIAAHQHAMMYAKQAYQMAVAQQAMAAAGDEWERGSAVGSYGGSGIIGASSGPNMMSPPFGMMPIGQGYGWSSPSSVYLPSSSRSLYGDPVNGGESTGNSRSEYGGARSPNNWSSSRSSYGESFGPSLNQYGRKNAQGLGTSRHVQRDLVSSSRVPIMPAAQSQSGGRTHVRSGNGQRDSAHFPPVSGSQFQSGRNPDSTPRLRTESQPASPSQNMYGRKAPPPSSWKAGL